MGGGQQRPSMGGSWHEQATRLMFMKHCSRTPSSFSPTQSHPNIFFVCTLSSPASRFVAILAFVRPSPCRHQILQELGFTSKPRGRCIFPARSCTKSDSHITHPVLDSAWIYSASKAKLFNRSSAFRFKPAELALWLRFILRLRFSLNSVSILVACFLYPLLMPSFAYPAVQGEQRKQIRIKTYPRLLCEKRNAKY